MMAALGMLIGFPAMEAIAWAMHKWIMHGPLWILHRSHHHLGKDREARGQGKWHWEANDAFGIFFSAISIALIGSGAAGRPFRLGLGLGMALYGLAYVLVHDALAHGRFGGARMPRNAYLRRLVRDHRVHHSRDRLDGTRHFGFLLPAPRRKRAKGDGASAPFQMESRVKAL
jgi:beta-carotene 3-hydroxylase